MQDTIIEEHEEVHYCQVHPERETSLRCITCNRYMCVQCAVRTPVGYRCRECVRGQQDKFFKANPADDVIAGAVCFVLAAVAGGIVSQLPLGIWIGLLLGLPAGGAISEVALRATGKRRSRYSHLVAAVSAIAGGVAGALIATIVQLGAVWGRLVEQAGLMGALNRISGASFSIGLLIFLGMAVVAIYGRYRMKM